MFGGHSMTQASNSLALTDYPDGVVLGDSAYERGFKDHSLAFPCDLEHFQV